jgi:hypothetical protein
VCLGRALTRHARHVVKRTVTIVLHGSRRFG